MNTIQQSLLLIFLVCSILIAGFCTLGEQVKAHHVDVNKPRMNTLIEQGVKP